MKQMIGYKLEYCRFHEHKVSVGREGERDTDKCILFMFRLGSNPRYQFTLHTVLTLKH